MIETVASHYPNNGTYKHGIQRTDAITRLASMQKGEDQSATPTIILVYCYSREKFLGMKENTLIKVLHPISQTLFVTGKVADHHRLTSKHLYYLIINLYTEEYTIHHHSQGEP